MYSSQGGGTTLFEDEDINHSNHDKHYTWEIAVRYHLLEITVFTHDRETGHTGGEKNYENTLLAFLF